MASKHAVTITIGLLLAGLRPCTAGLYHVGDSLVCSTCHTMHYSMQHNYTGGLTNLITDPAGPYPKLLKSSPNDLCLACHDGTGTAPDVLGRSTETYGRQAGALNKIGHVESGYEHWKGHTLDGEETAPGGDWANSEEGLLCIDCHAHHGIESQYRNLWTTDIPGDKFENKTLTFVNGSNDLTKDVYFSSGGMFPKDRYGTAAIKFNEPDATKSAYANWCASCHGDFHGAGGDTNMGGASGGDAGSNPWKRHPASDVNIGQNVEDISSLAQFQSHTNRVKVASSSGNWDTGTDVTPSCFSCHKAHGNKNPFGLIYMSGTGTVTEEGDTGGSQLPNLCRQCHIQ